jgi:plasmid stabilization system protein ParE
MIDYSFHPQAEKELLEASQYYEARRVGLGPAFLTAIQETIQIIRANPGIGTLLEGQIRKKPARRFPYNILYSQESSNVFVLAVMHQKRRPGYWRDRL